jgi:hypothetical protein
MQAQMTYSTGSQFRVLYNVLRREGFIGLYRGCIPPLISSPILRSVQFGAYAEGLKGATQFFYLFAFDVVVFV